VAIAPVDLSDLTWVTPRFSSRALSRHHRWGNLFDDTELALQVYNDL
jgi:hypothetical protein